MKDEWVTTALSNDSVVVELLFRLKQSSSQPAKPPPSLYLPLGWGHRQPRSKPSTVAKKDSATTTSITRFSPTTPLSWSGGAASPSDGAYEDCSNSSRPSFDPSRSKGSCYANEDTNATATATCKRSRKKRTFAELKEVENFLLTERVNLTKELASLHVTLKEQKARRENLKRIKIDLNLNSSTEPTVVVPNQSSNHMEASTSSDPAAPSEDFQRNAAAATHEGYGSSSSPTRAEKEVDTAQQRCFFLPDLNMTPSEQEEENNSIIPEAPYGIS